MKPSAPEKNPALVVIGASAGALEALSVILPALPGDFPLPVMVVVHVPQDRKSTLAEIFASKCRMTVKEAEDKEPLRPGTVYIAPPGYHLLVEVDFSVSLSSDEPVLYSRPSIDVLFESAADACGDTVTGIILTGANSDGARGLRRILDAGGAALVQAPEGASAAAMPQAALDACPGARSLPLEQIPKILLTEIPQRHPS